MVNLYGFIKWSSNLLLVGIELVEEFVRNYDPEDGSSVVKDRIVSIQAEILHQICKMLVGMEASKDFKAESHFKMGARAMVKDQGWKVMDALTLETREWMCFVQKRLALNRHTTYIAKKILYAAVALLDRMHFNWAEYVASQMYIEFFAKKALGKVLALLCSNYVSEAIKYQLK